MFEIPNPLLAGHGALSGNAPARNGKYSTWVLERPDTKKAPGFPFRDAGGYRFSKAANSVVL